MGEGEGLRNRINGKDYEEREKGEGHEMERIETRRSIRRRIRSKRGIEMREERRERGGKG